MTPAEAAGLLGLPENATEAQINAAYAARAAAVPDSDVAAVDALARARDALLAGVRWQPPRSEQPNGWGMPPSGTTPIGLAPQVPPPPQGGGAPVPPDVAMPGVAPVGGLPPAGTGSMPQPGYPPQPQYPAYAGPHAYPAPPRRRLSDGAIIGMALGGTAVLLVILLVAVFALVGSSHPGSVTAAPQHDSAAAPPGSPSPSDPSADGQSYVIDGVTIQPEDGWTFLLTSGRDCPGAEVIVGFADTIDGDTIDQLTETVTLQAGVPYTYTVPDTASTHEYAGIDDLQCIPT